jgi:hypothetical protein
MSRNEVNMTTYTVWVGGIPDVERVTYAKAVEVHDEWIADGYDDVVIEKDGD